MKRRWLLAMSFVLLVVLTLVAAGCSVSAPTTGISGESGIILSQQNSGIWVTGEGKVSVKPDVAILNLGVEAQAKTVAEAQQQAKEAMGAVTSALDKLGVAEKDRKTQYFSIYPVTRWEKDKEILIGYRVTNMVTAKIRKVDDTGIIIDAVTQAGGDYIRISSISFAVDDPTIYSQQVRETAMADAEAKAKQLANLAKVELGKPTYVNESGGYLPPPVPYYKEAGAAPQPATPISPGEIEIRLTVQVVYSIK